MNIKLGRVKKSRIKFMNKKYYLNEKEIFSDISISGIWRHSFPHFLNLINQIENEVNIIMFMDKYNLKNYLARIEEKERKNILIRHISSSINLSNNILNKHKTIIYIISNEKQEKYLLKNLEKFYQSNIKEKIKIAIFSDSNYIDKSLCNDIDDLNKKNKSKNVSLFYLCFELHESINADLYILHRHYDPHHSMNKLKELHNNKKLLCVRDLRALGQENFFLVNKKEDECKYCEYNFSSINKEVDVEDYIQDPMVEKINNF